MIAMLNLCVERAVGLALPVKDGRAAYVQDREAFRQNAKCVEGSALSFSIGEKNTRPLCACII